MSRLCTLCDHVNKHDDRPQTRDNSYIADFEIVFRTRVNHKETKLEITYEGGLSNALQPQPPGQGGRPGQSLTPICNAPSRAARMPQTHKSNFHLAAAASSISGTLGNCRVPTPSECERADRKDTSWRERERERENNKSRTDQHGGPSIHHKPLTITYLGPHKPSYNTAT